MEEVLRAFDFVYAIEVFLEIRIGVWETVSEELLVIVVGERVGKCQTVIGPEKAIIVTFVLVRNIGYFFTNSVPSYSFGFFDFVGKTQDLHAVIVERIWFRKIEDVELYFLSSLRVADSEKVPLRMTVSVNVILED